MREILFRGKRINSEEWIEGSLLCYPDGDCSICAVDEQTNELLYQCFVQPQTVGQYTGLKDRDGQRIFEGDILKEYRFGNKNYIHVVGFGESSFGTSRVVKEKVDNFFIPFDDSDNIMCTWLESEVIGNIHDNGELIHEK